ncbi:MAG: ABC transporter permease [Synergistales bacterium]|jgi:ABC-2 type transport system permease protein
MRRLRALLVKEFIQMGRDRLTLAIMGLLPVIQLLIFGFAINTEVKHLPTAVFDQSVSAESRELIRGFQSTGYFDIRRGANSLPEMNALVQSGRVKVGISIPPDFQERLRSGRQAAVQVIVDASDSMSAASAISTAQMIGLVRSQQILYQRLSPGLSENPALAVDVRIRPWYNPDMVSSHYMVPGILAIVLAMTMMMITSMAIVRERERGTLEQLIVTPLRNWELMVGKILPYVVVGYVQLTLGLLIGIVVFRIPVRGSLVLYYGLTSLHILASLAWGLLISSVAKTQMQAMQMSFFALMPSILLSGFMFPREAMPAFFRAVSNILPVTFFLQISRGILLKGVGLSALWPQVLSLFGLLVFFLGLSILKFRKTIA